MIHIVVRDGWEYNDEYYYRPNGGGGFPIEAFDSIAEARAVVTAKNIQECKDILSSDSDDIMCYLGEGESVRAILSPNKRWGKKLSKQDSDRLLSYFDIKVNYYHLRGGEEEPIGISKNAQSNVPDKDWLMLADYLGFNSYSVSSIPYVKEI